jgi:hypothetical protein
MARRSLGRTATRSYGLDDVVQGIMFPMGDGATGRVRGRAKRCGLKDARHLHIGRTRVGDRQVTHQIVIP